MTKINKQVTIKSLNDEDSGTPNLHNLIDEQNMIQYPSDYMQNTYFDEIYFVRTAEQYVQHSSSIYEWTHPPLGKLIQASSLVIFGFNPFGWRIMGVIFGTLMIPLIFFCWQKNVWHMDSGGFSAAFLLTFDFMHFTDGTHGYSRYVRGLLLAGVATVLLHLPQKRHRQRLENQRHPPLLGIFLFRFRLLKQMACTLRFCRRTCISPRA